MNGLGGWMKFVLCVLIGGFSARFIFSKYSRILSYKFVQGKTDEICDMEI